MHGTLHRALLEHVWLRWIAVVVTLSVLGAAAIAEAAASPGGGIAPRIAAVMKPAVVIERRLIWEGADIDGDGAADFVNPTGHAPREHDAYGYGHFGASRDGGSRDHEGVDYAGDPGAEVLAPISGYVTRIGHAYDDAPGLKYVEISNPALDYEARVFYVDPDVQIGDAVVLGDVIGEIADLTRRYPGGMTNHVHLELKDRSGDRIDATEMITARVELIRRRA